MMGASTMPAAQQQQHRVRRGAAPTSSTGSRQHQAAGNRQQRQDHAAGPLREGQQQGQQRGRAGAGGVAAGPPVNPWSAARQPARHMKPDEAPATAAAPLAGACSLLCLFHNATVAGEIIVICGWLAAHTYVYLLSSQCQHLSCAVM
jgi:Flp pilus assembly protein TadB